MQIIYFDLYIIVSELYKEAYYFNNFPVSGMIIFIKNILISRKKIQITVDSKKALFSSVA